MILEKLLGNEIKLGEIDSWLNTTRKIEQIVTGLLSFETEENGEKKIYKTISKTIVTEGKGKEYKKLQRFVNDRRLPELFEYFSDEQISLDCLKTELECYNKQKQEIQDIVFKLEKKLCCMHLEEISMLFTDNNGDQKRGTIEHKPYLKWLLNKGYIDETTFTFMKMVRNCFFHNQFPQKTTMELIIKKWDANRFAFQIATEYIKIVDALINNIA